MAVSHNNNLNKFFLFLTLTLVTATVTEKTTTTTTTTAAAVSHNLNRLTIRDLNAAIFTLRSNGYNLFANAIAVSDLSFQILTDKNDTDTDNKTKDGEDKVVVGRSGYTLLAPPNSALFSLDMSTDAFTYVNSLRFHVVMRRLSYSELRRVAKSGEPYVETLAGSQITAVARNGGGLEVDGALIAFPNMYLRPNIAVHGLDGILVSSATRVDDLGFLAAPQPFAGAFSPEIAAPTPEIRVPTPETGAQTPEFSVSAPDIGAPSPVTSFGSFTIGNSFDSVSVPPIEYYSSEFAETPTPSPSPASSLPECSEWSDCEIEDNLSPYNWPTTESITPTGSTSSTSPSPESSLWTSRKLAVSVEKRDEESRRYGLGWGVDETETNRNRNRNHDYADDDVNFGRNNDNDEDDEFLLPPELNWW